jgi:hypothetical protein
MSARRQKFESYATHPWLKKAFGKLSAAERTLARDFIDRHDQLLPGDFEYRVHRMFMDQPEKPKNWTVINELLVCCNSISSTPRHR